MIAQAAWRVGTKHKHLECFLSYLARELGSHSQDGIADVCVLTGKRWPLFAKPNGIVYDQHLPVARGARADTNGWDSDGASDCLGQYVGNMFQHDEKGPGLRDAGRLS